MAFEKNTCIITTIILFSLIFIMSLILIGMAVHVCPKVFLESNFILKIGKVLFKYE